ncbi:RING-type E3 ubiquitin transferase [Salvia divinorum]|uniref:RING-type E3 ubiquitin transferase n=1 Tax=Salvia divinorum TaxID=28513 RepID=A0ABD1HU19_SALDI
MPSSHMRWCLHHICDGLNPYQQSISIIGRTLSPFDENNLIPCFGFGSVTTHDKDDFNFYDDNRPCNGFVNLYAL